MSNHLTPEELADKFRVPLEMVNEVIRKAGLPMVGEPKVCVGLFEPHLKQHLLAAV